MTTKVRFRTWYRIALLSVVALCAFYVSFLTRRFEDIAFFLIWQSVPYLLLALLHGFVKSNAVLLVTTAICLGIDVLSDASVLEPAKSTAAVGLILVPLWQILLVIPGGMVLDRLLVWGYSGFPIRRTGDSRRRGS